MSIQVRIEHPAAGWRGGGRGTVLGSQPVEAEGVLVPRSALIRRGNGETGIWTATADERFEPLRVRWKPVDGSVVAIEAGLPDGARVVLSGATMLSAGRCWTCDAGLPHWRSPSPCRLTGNHPTWRS